MVKPIAAVIVLAMFGCQSNHEADLRPARADAPVLEPYLAAADAQAEQVIKQYDEPPKGKKKPDEPVYFADYDRTVQQGTWKGRAVVVVTYVRRATAPKEAPPHFSVWVDKTTRQTDLYEE